MHFFLQNSGNTAIKNGLKQMFTHLPALTTNEPEKEARMATKALNYEPENRQPFADADVEKHGWLQSGNPFDRDGQDYPAGMDGIYHERLTHGIGLAEPRILQDTISSKGPLGPGRNIPRGRRS